MGGLIKYVTKRPDTERFGIDLQASVEGIQDGGTDYNGAATVNAPIVADKAALRASTFYSRGGGYIDNSALNEKDVNQSSIYGARADLLLTPADALTVRIAGIVQNISRDGEATADYTFSGAMPYGSLGQNRQYAEPFDQRFRLFSGTINYDFGSVELTSITSYQTARSGGLWDASAVYVPLFELFGLHYSAIGGLHNSRTNKFAQEIRLAAAGNRPLEWVIGGFYTKEQSRYAEEFVLRDLDGEPTPNFLYSYLTPSRYEEHAAFGDLTWNLTDDFDVSGGIRYARNRQKYVQLASSAFTTPQAERNASESVATYLVNARYRFGDHATGYLRYATGYRPGGPNFPTTDPDGNPLGPDSFEADRLKSYEIGLKSESRDRRFGIDVAAYNIDWNNMQISVIRGGFGIIENAPGGARVRGAELVLSARPTRGLDLAGAFAFQDAELSEADPDLGAANGERLPNVPRVTAALNADYELPLGSWQPTVGATLRYVDDRTSSFDNNASRPQYHLPEYTTFDLRAGFTLGAVDAQMYVHNLFNEHGQLSSMLSVFGARIGILQPRTIGLAVTKQFR
jgi:outer membrane receptor protein involved in Fe transport